MGLLRIRTMSNPLQKLINRYLSDNNITRTNLAKQLGYTNVSKGLKRLDEFLITLQSPNPELPALILKQSDISADEFEIAYTAVLDAIDDQKGLEFIPMIRVTPKRRPSPIFAMIVYNIPVPENITSLDFYEELSIIRNLYKDHKIKFPTSTGFRYFRTYGETLEFDSDCQLVEQCIPIQ